MEILIKIAQFLLSFSLLIFVHELGHYLSARMFGIRVEKFYIFFDPWFSLVKFKIGHTEYGIGWIPFGGYCKISGMIDESLDTDQLSSEPQPWEFRSRPAWQRLIVMLGGVIMNIILAMVIYIGMTWTWGDKYIANDDLLFGWTFNALGHEVGFRDGDRILSVGGTAPVDYRSVYPEIVMNHDTPIEILRDGRPLTMNIEPEFVGRMLDSPDFMKPRAPFVVGRIVPESPAERAGILAGDSLVGVNGEAMTFYDDCTRAIRANASKVATLTVVRDSSGVQITRAIPVEISQNGTIGAEVYTFPSYIPEHRRQYTFLQSIPAGLKRTGTELSDYGKQIKMLVTPGTQAYKSLGGPITIFRIVPDFWNWENFWTLAAFLSVILAVMNILPIPGLDGGHVMFVLYEMITRRKPGEKFLLNAQLIGMVILLALMVYATSNDIQRLLK